MRKFRNNLAESRKRPRIKTWPQLVLLVGCIYVGSLWFKVFDLIFGVNPGVWGILLMILFAVTCVWLFMITSPRLIIKQLAGEGVNDISEQPEVVDEE